MKIDVLSCHSNKENPTPGFVRLVSYMQPAEEAGYTVTVHEDMERGWTGDLEIVRNARVSHDADWRTGDDAGKDAKLVNYLYSHRHSTPFEAMVFTFEVKAPIFVLRQWHRHRTWSYNEVSARYTELDEGWYIPEAANITVQSGTNRQQRTDEQHPAAQPTRELMHELCLNAFEGYAMMLQHGIPRELARSVLPVAAYSRMFATVDLHNLFHFLTLRMSPHAQYEIRVYAKALLDLVRPVVPNAVAAFEAGQEQP